MNIRDFLSAADVAIDVRATDKAGLLKELAARSAASLNLPAAMVIERDREARRARLHRHRPRRRHPACAPARGQETVCAAGTAEEPHRVRCRRRSARRPRVPAAAAGCFPTRPAQRARRRRAQAEGCGRAAPDARCDQHHRALSGRDGRVASPWARMASGRGHTKLACLGVSQPHLSALQRKRRKLDPAPLAMGAVAGVHELQPLGAGEER